MKASALLFVVAVLLPAGAASAQVRKGTAAGAAADSSGAQGAVTEVDRILLGAPIMLRAEATVIKWRPDYTYETLKKGTNRLVCFNRADEDRRYTFAVECTSLGNLPRVAQNRQFRAESKSAEEEKAKVDAAEKNGTRLKPEYGSTFINTNGDDQMHLRVHTTIALPGATAASTGLPDKPGQGGVWIMDAGTTGAHLMLPGH